MQAAMVPKVPLVLLAQPDPKEHLEIAENPVPQGNQEPQVPMDHQAQVQTEVRSPSLPPPTHTLNS